MTLLNTIEELKNLDIDVYLLINEAHPNSCLPFSKEEIFEAINGYEDICVSEIKYQVDNRECIICYIL